MDVTDVNLSEFEQLKPLQEKHLEMLAYIKQFCDEHKIQWTLAYGSALGARRHGGPIPWDDDVDIAMSAKDYEKFREAFQKYGNHNLFYLQELVVIGDMPVLPKLRLNGTTFIEEAYADLDMHHEIYIDIFLLHKAPRNKIKKCVGCFFSIYAHLKLLADQGYNKRKSTLLLMELLRLLPKYFGVKYIMGLWYKWDLENSNEIAEWFVKPKFMPLDYMFPFKPIQYNNLTLWAPNRVEEYLKVWYGEWQKIPNMKKIEWHQHASVWSIDEDFRFYAKNIYDFSDEMMN